MVYMVIYCNKTLFSTDYLSRIIYNHAKINLLVSSNLTSNKKKGVSSSIKVLTTDSFFLSLKHIAKIVLFQAEN